MADQKKIDIIKNSKPYKVWDLAVLAVVAALIIILTVTAFSRKGESVRITYNGSSSEYLLSVNREINIEDKIVINIENGKCFVKSADCPDKVCMHSGAISYVNQIIICAPYGVVVKVVGRSGNVLITGAR